MKSTKVFSIVVTYKGKRWYEDCFNSLINSSLPNDVFIVDNNSDDGTVEYIHTNYPNLHVVESKQNLGFGRANNLGIRYALDHGCDYVLLLNQDAWVEPDTIERLVEIADRHPEYGIIAPVQVDKQKTKVLDGVVDFLTYKDNINKKLISDLIIGKTDEVYTVPEMNAAAWLISRKTLEVVGGFDPLFLHYGEDWNYQSRMQYHGLKMGFVPNVRVVHDCVERVEQRKGYSASYDKWMLQRATDLLYPDNEVDKMISFYRKKAINKLFTFQKESFLINWKAYRFLVNKRTEILSSRVENKKQGSTWL